MSADKKEPDSMISQEQYASSKAAGSNLPQSQETTAKDRLFEDLLRRAAEILSGEPRLAPQES